MRGHERYAEMAAQLDSEISATRPDIQSNDGVILASGSSIHPKPIRWLWEGWLAKGKMHILAGAPGQGKTTLAMTMAATVTIGGRWPDGSWAEPGNILVWSGEDDAADTLLPRLLAMGADRERCFFVSGTRLEGQLYPFDPSRDMGQLLQAVERIGGFGLIVVDPVVSAVTGDGHSNTEVRRSLQPLVDLAAATGCAILGITHFSKAGQGQDPTQRVVGSVAFSAVARVVLVAAKVTGEDGEPSRILARSKSNIGPDEGGFQYHLDQVEALPDIQASRVTWGKSVHGSARELLKEQEADGSGDTHDASEMLAAELSDTEWTNSEFASKPLKDAGFTKKQIWSASKKIGVIRKKGGMDTGWYWRLPSRREGSSEDSEGSSFQNKESSEPSGEMESSATGGLTPPARSIHG